MVSVMAMVLEAALNPGSTKRSQSLYGKDNVMNTIERKCVDMILEEKLL